MVFLAQGLGVGYAVHNIGGRDFRNVCIDANLYFDL